jgi:GNAT superfamily N-acetyltransferase
MVRLPGSPLPTAPAELRIVEVADAATLADVERVLIDGFPLPELQPVRAGSLFDERVLGGPLRLWVGYLDDRPVTTAGALADEVLNGIYCVATLAEARGRGYGMAITARAVAASPALPAVLQASDLGYRIYQRLGFTEVARYGVWLKPR